MSRNTLLFLGAIVAVVAGLLVSYFPPPQNAVAIWSMVSMFIGYGIRDLFGADKPPSPPPAAPVTPDLVAPAAKQ
ncbi:hypothetical protein FHW67_002699 [Herbaspirillum sp. Sphag1AN]|uniref:hypothetical protein n=1 Tax=unclassified Herbaspirillum TaxID=2624150 RepID=UPI00160751EF|nr:MULTISPECIES: hypothetical protein [unclassified Herbaspirillum]MBB3213407.1 hypothetical protein [Herbaspirillum sp. Sphag1AN]MBB3246549.1 hypothetical protein [Herbaspirillum sp. Sphag64]